MENKINIAELLKDCPKGMELDCMMFENVFFDCVTDNPIYPIRLYVQSEKDSITLTSFGCTTPSPYAKCVIFPKGKTTWEGFQIPFKDGDIAISERGDIHLLKTSSSSYCAYRESWKRLPKFDSTITTNVTIVRLATEEEKQKLFDAIKTNGYKWNDETKTLEKLVEPKFKVGDKIKDKNNKIWFVVQVSDKHFSISLIPNAEGYFVPIEDQDDYELVPNKFDITTLKPYESRVLVRGDIYNFWKPAIFGFIKDKIFYLLGGAAYEQCIPYKNNEHLLGTKNDCDEYYKTWE